MTLELSKSHCAPSVPRLAIRVLSGGSLSGSGDSGLTTICRLVEAKLCSVRNWPKAVAISSLVSMTFGLSISAPSVILKNNYG